MTRYQIIFALQKTGKWWAANQRIKRLENRMLMGHVLAQRYLHPTRYRSKYEELRAWLAKYPDHPDARRIYRLAMKRKPAGARASRRPVIGYFKSGAGEYAASAPYRSKKRLNRGQRRRVAILQSSIDRHLKAGKVKTAEHLLSHKEVRKLFDDVEIDAAKSKIADAYFRRGRDRKAFKLASQSAARSGRQLPSAHWTAGLAAWRLGMFADAASHFEAVARARNLSPWNLAAGAYWAARAHLLSRRPQNVNRWLTVAAEHPRTFYGLLARHSLGLETDF
ncbi:MAG: lytic transglycosylase domain-containing protein, partial [Alphaproteobacteria bacterium]